MNRTKIGELIAARQDALGLSDEDLCVAAGVSVAGLDDLKKYGDEFATAIPLEVAGKLIQRLGISWSDVVPLQRVAGSVSPRRTLRDLREAAGLSVSAVADTLGYQAEVIEGIELDIGILNRYPLEFVTGLAGCLKCTPLQLLDLIVEPLT